VDIVEQSGIVRHTNAALSEAHIAEANSQLGLVAQVLKTEAALYSQVGKMDEALVAITHSLTLARAIG